MDKRLPLTDAPALILIKAIEAKLRSDPTLTRVVKTWCTFNGEPNEVQEPSVKDLPYLRLETAGNQSYRDTEGTSETPVDFDVVLFVEGSLKDNIINLWYAVHRVIFPGDGTMQSILQTNNATGLNLSKPLYGVEMKDGSKIMGAVGTVQVVLYTNTAL